MHTEGGIDAKFVTFRVLFFVATVRSIPLNILSFDDFFDTFVVFGFVMTNSFVDFDFVSLLRTLLLALALGLVPRLLLSIGMQLRKQRLVGFLKLLNVGLAVLKQIDLFSLELLDLRFQSIGIKLELLLDLNNAKRTLTFFRISISCFCSMVSNLRYSYSKLRCLTN